MTRKKVNAEKVNKISTINRNKVVIVASFIVVSVIVLMIGFTIINSKIVLKEDKQWNASDKIHTDKFEISILSIDKRTQVGSGIYESKPAANWLYLTVHWDWKNISKESIKSIEIPTIQLVDKNGTKYDADLGASMSFATEFNLDTKIFRDLNPGVSVSDSSVFEVSTDLVQRGEYKLIINADKELYVDIKDALSNRFDKLQQTSNSNKLNSKVNADENKIKETKKNDTINSKEETNKQTINDLINTEIQVEKIAWDSTMGMNYSISEVSIGDQGGATEFIIGRYTPNGTRVLLVSGNQNVNILREIATFPQVAFDDWGELKKGYKIEACFYDLDGDGEKELLLAIGDGIANLGVSIIKIENKGASMEYTEIGYIEGKDKIAIIEDNKILVPFGSKDIYKEYRVQEGNLLKIY